MKSKKKTPVKKKPVRKPRKKPATLTAAQVKVMFERIDTRLQGLTEVHMSLYREVENLKSWLDRAVGPMIHRLALLGDWNLIKPEDGQRLMSTAGGEMTPVYIEWHLATFGVQATRERYAGRINAMPPYLRMKL